MLNDEPVTDPVYRALNPKEKIRPGLLREKRNLLENPDVNILKLLRDDSSFLPPHRGEGTA